MGQLYAGRPKRALAFFLVDCGTGMLYYPGLVGRSLATFGVTMALILLITITAAIDAAIQERRREDAPSAYQRWWGALLIALPLLLTKGALTDHVRVLHPYRIPTDVMSPSLEPGDHLMAAEDAFEDRPPRVGDLVIFRGPSNGRVQLKRVVAVAGDRVEVQAPLSPPIVTPGSLAQQSSGNTASGMVVPEGTIFVVGDNHGSSRDSRHYGPVSLDEVIGAPLYIYWSIDRAKIGRSLRNEDLSASTGR